MTIPTVTTIDLTFHIFKAAHRCVHVSYTCVDIGGISTFAPPPPPFPSQYVPSVLLREHVI